VRVEGRRLSWRLDRDNSSAIVDFALAPWLSMIFSENRFPLFGIML